MSSNERIATLWDLSKIPAQENNEPLVDLQPFSQNIVAKYEKQDMIPYVGNRIFVRETVAKKLAGVALTLSRQHGFTLRVVYGYRHPEVQEKYFKLRRATLAEIHHNLSDSELDTLTHNFVAMPSVAGHPTGGAVDVTIADKIGDPLDMGTSIADFSDPEKIKTFASEITDIQKKNRLLLHDLMVQEEFAPFYGEWWHFSYGDREWAFYFEKPYTFYDKLEMKS